MMVKAPLSCSITCFHAKWSFVNHGSQLSDAHSLLPVSQIRYSKKSASCPLHVTHTVAMSMVCTLYTLTHTHTLLFLGSFFLCPFPLAKLFHFFKAVGGCMVFKKLKQMSSLSLSLLNHERFIHFVCSLSCLGSSSNAQEERNNTPIQIKSCS